MQTFLLICKLALVCACITFWPGPNDMYFKSFVIIGLIYLFACVLAIHHDLASKNNGRE